MGEEELGANLVGPSTAEDLILIGDDRVGGVEAKDLQGFGGRVVGLGGGQRGLILFVGRRTSGRRPGG